jgi:O-antigen/teichoic acid export membrane protein
MFRKIKNKISQLILLKTALKSLALKSSGAGLNFIVGIIIARLLGVSDFGIYSLVLTFFTMLGMLSNLGMASYYTRETAILISKGRVSEVFNLTRSAEQLIKYTTVALVLIGLVTVHTSVLGVSWNSMNIYGWFMAILIIPFFSLNVIRAAILRGMDKIILADTPDIFIKPFFVIILIGFGVFVNYDHTPSSIIIIQSLAFILVFTIATVNLRTNLTDRTTQHDTPSHNNFNRNTVVFFVISFLTILQAQLPFYMTGYFLGHESAGLFQACLQLVNVLVIGLTAVNSPLQPKVAAAWSQGDKVKVQKLITESVRIASTISVVFFTIIYLSSEHILSLYGKEFIIAGTALKLLLVGQLINAFCGPCALLLIMINRQEIVLKGFFGSIIIGLALGVWLIPSYGIEGAAFVSISIMMFWNISMAYYCFTALSINTLPIGSLTIENGINKNG